MLTICIRQKFNHFVVLERIGTAKDGHSIWLCQCDCGTEKIIRSNNLRRTKSCGCQKYKHNKTNTTIYHVWSTMIQRCTNPNNKDYHNYGGRGITVCKEWLEFSNFYKDMGECPKRRSIDRINNDGNYYKENCRWATSEEQGSNKRNNYMITFDNKTQCVAQWSRETGIHEQTLWRRIHLKWPTEKILTQPVRKTKNKRNK